MNEDRPDKPRGRENAGRAWFVVALLMFLVGVGYAVFTGLTTSDLANADDDLPLFILGAAGLVLLLGWWWDRARRTALDEEARRERERLESELEEREEALDRERSERSRLEEAHRAEKDWGRRLHAEVMQAYRERGSLADPGDVPSMVLRLTRTLLEAEKGLLLWLDEDGGGEKLGLAAAEGFGSDPENSAVARRFAGEALERNRAVREESPPQEAEAGRRAGADEEIENLVAIPIYLQDEFSGVVVCANNPDGFEGYDEEVLLSVGDQAGAVLQNARLQGELRASYLATVGVLADAIGAKDPFLRGHSEEVSGYAAAVADRLGLPQGRREELLFGSLLHDVGKIGISERILLKPAALTPEERAAVRLHSRIGYRLLEQVPALRPVAAPAVLHHHERFDGGGYPSGLSGEEIPLEARIICVADSFSAMIEERPYREAMTVEEACAELERGAGTQFDPEVVRVFVEEVRHRPPVLERRGLAAAMEDPEIQARRNGDEPVPGYGAIALVDNLTMLYTRRHFHESAHAEAQRSAAKGRPFGVALAELAGLAELNRRQGYAAGDEAIRAAGRVLQRVAARHGSTAYRHGGHRLGLLVPDTDEEAAAKLADEILAGLDKEGLPARTAAAAWRPADDGEAVIARARALLNVSPELRGR